MAKLRDFSQGKLEAFKIDPRKIEIKPGFNCRDTSSPESKKHIAWLKQSIAERGVDEPIWVENTGEKLLVVDGHCRILALRELWNEGNEIFVPSISYKGDEAAVLAKSLISNNGLPLTVLEIGEAAARLEAYGWTLEKISTLVAPHLGYTPKAAERHVKDAVELHQAPLEVKEMVKRGVDGVKISPALAVQETRRSREKAPAKIREVAAAAKKAGKTEAKRGKEPGPATKLKINKDEALAAAEVLAVAVDLWIEDATDKAEKKLLSAHKAYRAIVKAPKNKAA